MADYSPEAIVRRYSSQNELTRLGRDPDTEIMFRVERWFLEKHLPEDGTVIDIGAGPGRYSVEIAKLGERILAAPLLAKCHQTQFLNIARRLFIRQLC